MQLEDNKRPLTIAVDFDGTIVAHRYPEIGHANPGAIDTLQWLIDQGCRVILLTMRDGIELAEALSYLHNQGVFPHAINSNPGQDRWTSSAKIYAHIYIDDHNACCPVRMDWDNKPMVDWDTVKHWIKPRLKDQPEPIINADI